MNFNYKALKDDKVVKGVISANTKKDAISKLKTRGFRPISLEENIQKNNAFSFRKKFSNVDLYFFFNQLELMLKTGITLDGALKISAETFKGQKREVILKIIEDLNRGISFEEALKSSGYFPNFAVNLVEAGENSANLEGVFGNLSVYYRKMNEFKKKILGATSYPCLLIIVSIILVNFLMLNVIPTFADIYEDSQAILPIFTRMLISISAFLRANFVLLAIIFLSLLLILIFYFSKNKRAYEKILLRINYYRRVYTLKFIFSIYTLLSSGLTIDRSMEIIGTMEDNSLIKEKLYRVLTDLRAGESYYIGLRNTNIFPKLFISMVRIGEESSNFEEVFKNFRDYYEKDMDTYNQRFVDILGPVLIIILSLIIGFIVLAIAMPIFDMVNRI
ncbi:type II secretion system F family protein [Peptoniphilus raoultii]|uniref:type II secretion system F family protein n=1 Tax=Peptoniphilus raoultii TaxID=1776387 RepID=UPI0008DA975B|nr:type II secretion system F family protein [Peptoniphilus raoultii]